MPESVSKELSLLTKQDWDYNCAELISKNEFLENPSFCSNVKLLCSSEFDYFKAISQIYSNNGASTAQSNAVPPIIINMWLSQNMMNHFKGTNPKKTTVVFSYKLSYA